MGGDQFERLTVNFGHISCDVCSLVVSYLLAVVEVSAVCGVGQKINREMSLFLLTPGPSEALKRASVAFSKTHVPVRLVAKCE